MIIEVLPKNSPPKENWDWADALTEVKADNGWLICCEIDTSGLLPEAEKLFLEQLRQIVFYRVKNHVVTINDFVTGIKQDAFYELVDYFGLKIIR